MDLFFRGPDLIQWGSFSALSGAEPRLWMVRLSKANQADVSVASIIPIGPLSTGDEST